MEMQLCECAILWYCIAENFAVFATSSREQNLYHANFLSCANDYIECMALLSGFFGGRGVGEQMDEEGEGDINKVKGSHNILCNYITTLI